MEKELWQRSGVELTMAYRSGECTPVDVVETVLQRIERINSKLNAFVTLDPAGARQAAEESAKRWQNKSTAGLLDGVPISIKDSLKVGGLRSTWGSRLYADFVPEADELPVGRLRSEGAIILGKTNCPEFTVQGYTDNLLFGVTRNPWDLALTPGGSSGGAVAAVAAGLGPIAIGTDAGGSIRRPASYTSLVGLKPSRGRVPRFDGFPVILLDFETVGPIARTVDDLMLVMHAISKYDPRDPLSLPFREKPFAAGSAAKRRILFVKQFAGSPVDPEIAIKVKDAATVFAELGHVVEEGDIPFEFEPLNAVWAVVTQTGLAWLLQSFPDWSGNIGPALKEMAANGQKRTAIEYAAALDSIRTLQKDLSVFFSNYDVILTPSAAALPWPAAEPFPTRIAGEAVGPRGHAIFTAFVNMAGCPGISVPAAPSEKGLPVGFQMVAAPGQDEMLCALAGQYEQVRPWAGRFPQL
jgi:aspartyl-tRNA(Asn)/glutamyl-tRNA(Gln) amidotransferase subunit A